MSTAAADPETPERREQLRRTEDVAVWSEIHAFGRNKVTRKITYIVVPLFFSFVTYAWTTWSQIPTQSWQDNVSAESERTKQQFIAIQTRMALLEQRLEYDAKLSEQQRQEIKMEIAGLRRDLERWFVSATRTPR